jgi:hypothetical protein
MSATRDDLTELNVEIGVREEAGDVEFFHHLLAPVFAMRRARDHHPFTDRLGFINGVKPSPARPTDDVKSLFESDRCAVVTCVVRMTTADAAEESATATCGSSPARTPTSPGP